MDRNLYRTLVLGGWGVALRKESVDRNFHRPVNVQPPTGRSPQGERG